MPSAVQRRSDEHQRADAAAVRVTGSSLTVVAGINPTDPPPPSPTTSSPATRHASCPGSAQLLGSALAPLLGFACDAHSLSPRGANPAHRTEIDHTVPYSAGGTTSATSLGGCCKHHHRAKDGGEYTLTRHGDTYHWTTPLGRTYTREPTPLWEPPPPTPPTPAPPRTNGETPDQRSDPAPPPEDAPF